MLRAGGEWTFPAGDYANTRFSDLADIDRGNVARLKLAFSFSTGVLRGHEAAPVVAGNTMYVITPFPNYLYALDLTETQRAGQVALRSQSESELAGVIACCDYVNRGVAAGRRPVYLQHPGRADLRRGCRDRQRIVARAARRLPPKGETVTMAPLVVKDKVLVGNAGSEYGARGWLAALNTQDGSIAWRAYSTGPDSEVLIDPAVFKPYYSHYVGKDLGVKEWPPDHWKIGGGTVWGWISYDPELDLIYHGTSNPSPWNHGKAARRKFLDRGNLCQAAGGRQGALVLPVLAAWTVGSLGGEREHPARRRLAGKPRKVAGASRAQWLHVRHRSYQR